MEGTPGAATSEGEGSDMSVYVIEQSGASRTTPSNMACSDNRASVRQLPAHRASTVSNAAANSVTVDRVCLCHSLAFTPFRAPTGRYDS